MAEILASASSALSLECNGRNGGDRWLVDAEYSVTTHCGSCVRYYVFTPVTQRSNIARGPRKHDALATGSNIISVLHRVAGIHFASTSSNLCHCWHRHCCSSADINGSRLCPMSSIDHCPSPKSVRPAGRTISTNVQRVILYGDSEDKNGLRMRWKK